jgi:hypothetical protein
MAFTNSNETEDVEMCQAGEALNVAVTSIDLSCHTVPSRVTGCEAEGITQGPTSDFGWIMEHERF